MTREPAHISELRRALGERLMAARRVAGLSQRELAHVLHYDRSSISHLEAGRHPAPRTFWQRADELLGAGGSLLAAYDALTQTKHDVAVRAAEATRTAARRQWCALRDAPEQQVIQAGGGGDQAGGGGDQAGGGGDQAGGGRTQVPSGSGKLDQSADPCWQGNHERAVDAVIQFWAAASPPATDHAVAPGVRTASMAAALAWLVAARPEGAQRTDGARSVSLADVEALEVMQRSLIALDHAHGGGAVLPMALAYLQGEVSPLLRGRYTEQIGSRLFAASAELALATAWIAYDASSHGLARRQLMYALRLSHVAGDRALGGHVLTTMSHHALYLGEHEEALILARAATSGVKTCPSGMRAICAATEARALAARGDRHACLALMGEAERALAKPATDEVPPWLRYLDEAELAGKFGRCLRDLGLHADAERQLETSLALHKPTYPRSRAITQIIFATNYVRQGQLERACQLGIEAIPVIGRLRSQRTREYLRDLHDHLTPHQREPAVQEFTDQARELLTASI